MTSPTVVCIHGRGQEAKDPDQLRTKWLAALNAGLTRAGAAGLSADRIAFPYYGDVLYRVTAESAGRPLRLESNEPGPIHPATPSDVGVLQREMLADMADHAGMAVPPREARRETAERSPGGGRLREEGLDRILSWRAARELLTGLARRSRVDQLVVEAHLRDVAMYLTRGRDAILREVRRGIPARVPLVLVSHSLGTVVARDLLSDDGIRERTALWVTAGSPLGLEAVQRNLLERGARNPGVPWLTAFDVNDVVALGHPLQKSWGDPLTDVEVQNDDDPHSIARYLAHARVAGPIGTAASGR